MIQYTSADILNTLFKILVILSVLILKILKVKWWEMKALVFKELDPNCVKMCVKA